MPSQGKRGRKIALSIFLFLFALSLFIVYIRYLDLKKALIEKGSEKVSSVIGQRIRIEDLSLSLPGAINLYGITIENPEGFPPGPLLRIGKLHLDLRLRELIGGRLSLRNVILYSPELTLRRDEQGRYNISDRLMALFPGKSTTQYQLEEFRIDSGTFDLNRGERSRINSINIRLKNISSEPSTRTEIRGTVLYAGNRVRTEGWVTLNDPAKRAHLTISCKDLRLSPFRRSLRLYKVDTEKTRISVDLQIDGDTEKGFRIIPSLQVERVGVPLLTREVSALRLQGDLLLALRDDSLIVQNMSLLVKDLSKATLKGAVTDLRKNPSYNVDIKIDRLDLSKLGFMKGLRVRGILSSTALRVKGRFESGAPELSGSFQLKEAGIESPDGVIEKIDADFILSWSKGISIKGEGLARVVKAGPYSLLKPLDVRLSATLNGVQGGMDILSSLTLSSAEITFKNEKTLSIGSGSVRIDGTLKDLDFSGKSSFELTQIQFPGGTIPWFKSRFTVDSQKGEIILRDPVAETEDLKTSANHIWIRTTESKSGYRIEAGSLNAAYRATEALIKEGDFELTFLPNQEPVTGDLRFSAKNILFHGIPLAQVSGMGRFDDKTFSVDIGGVEFAGGRVKAAVQGGISEGFFPLRVTLGGEGIDFGTLWNLAPKSMKPPYHVAGEIKRVSFEGIVHSQESLSGHAALEARKLSVFNPAAGRTLFKDASFTGNGEFKGSDLSFTGEASAGNVVARLSGVAKGLMAKALQLQAKAALTEVPISDIRNTFWDIFPDSLLYVGLQGSVSSEASVTYGREGLEVNGSLLLKDFTLEGENREYSIGPIRGTVPIQYGKDRAAKEGMTLPSFEKPQFEQLSRTYAQETSTEGLYRLTVGSLRYGFPLLENITLSFKPGRNLWNIERLSADVFGGKLNGSAIIDLSAGFRCRGGLLLKAVSLRALCDGIEPIRGFMSGKADGIANFRASEFGLSQLMGIADFWTYSTGTEKTMISKEFLQRVGGPSMKVSLRNRDFDKGILSLYMKDGDLIFKDLEISNRNFFGVTDLSVKVAPLSNRISIDHLMGTIAEAAERAKKK
ncbi:MAG: DUF748 domain-containing protein [Thermodesulfobacteriota bacterium]